MSTPHLPADRPQCLARAIEKRGLKEPTILLLVAMRPFRYLLNQLMVIVAPLVGWDNGLGTVRHGWLLENQDHFDYLITLLEEPENHAHSETEQ